ncbi:MAG: hypothetical protein IID34_10555 [Planctomycetes bacterium]|nr:hypothetical protein [Planctomycetota bacterium]
MVGKRIGQTNPTRRKLKAGLWKRLVLPLVGYGFGARSVRRMTLEGPDPAMALGALMGPVGEEESRGMFD